MTIVEAAEVRQRLTMPVCIDLMRTSLRELEAGNYTQPLRSIALLPGGEKFGFMPASSSRRLARIRSIHTGMVSTGAVSGVATDLLARPDAHRLAIIGAGAQGRSHLAAMTVVRDIHSVTVYDQNTQTARRYCQEMEEKFGIPVTAADSVREAVCDADIVCTVTPSREPYLESDWIAPGTHINAVGAFTPTTREVTSTLVAKARLYADQVEAMRKECGEYLVPLQEGLIGPDHIVGSLGDVLLGRVPGRSSGEEITLFDALGLAVEDVACVKYLCGGSRS